MNGFEIFPLASFLILIILIYGRVVILNRKGIKVSAGKTKKSKFVRLLYPIFLLIILLWFFQLIKSVFHISFSVLPEILTNILVESVIRKISGVAIVSGSLILLLLTLLNFKNSLRFGMDETNKGELITTGIFSVSRNPFFLSLELYFLGIAILFPNLFFIGFAVLSLVSIHFFILKEEKYLRKMYGKEYDNYSQKVRRYF